MSDAIAEAVLAGETIYEKVRGLYHAQEEESARLQALETKKKKTRLGRDEYLNMLMLQDSVALRLVEIAEAERQLRYDQADVAITQASVRHDQMVPQVRAVARQIVGLLGAVHTAIRDLDLRH